MADKKKAFKSSKKGYSVAWPGKYPKFTCACGSEMWDNRRKKKTPKSPDLRCKNADCPNGTDGFPNAVWLDEKEKERLGMAKGGQKNNNGGSQKSTATQTSGGVNIGTDMQLSYYGAWAKDIAIEYAKKNDVPMGPEFQALYEQCLDIVGSALDKHAGGLLGKKVPEDQQIKDVEEMDDSLDIDEDNLDEPEDVEDVSDEVDDDAEDVEDVEDDDDDVAEKDVSEDAGFEDLDDVDL